MYRADGPVEMRPVGEVEFVQGLAAASASGLYGPCRAAAAIVGHANLKLGDRVEPVLEALQAASPNRFRGIRHTDLGPDPRVESREKEGVLGTPEFRAGAQVLARMGLSLDTVVCFPQLPELAAFAQAVPDLTIILNHLGGLNRTGPYANRDDEVLPAWRSGMAAVAACPNVILKLGGIGMPRLGFDWHTREKPIGSEELAAAMAPLLTYCIEQFGPDRCMFESNFPVDKVSFSLPGAVQRLQAVLQGVLGRGARGAVPRHGGAGLPDQRRVSTAIIADARYPPATAPVKLIRGGKRKCPRRPPSAAMPRFPMTQMTPEQQEGYRSVIEMRGPLAGPNKIWVHNPKLAKVAGALGAHFRQGNYSLTEREREIAVCVINSKWHSAYPTAAHERRGKEVGLPADKVEAMLSGLPTSFDDKREQVVYEMAICLANARWVSKGLYDRAVEALGHVGITDVITLMGHYTSVSMTLAFYDVPAGAPGMKRE